MRFLCKIKPDAFDVRHLILILRVLTPDPFFDSAVVPISMSFISRLKRLRETPRILAVSRAVAKGAVILIGICHQLHSNIPLIVFEPLPLNCHPKRSLPIGRPAPPFAGNRQRMGQPETVFRI